MNILTPNFNNQASLITGRNRTTIILVILGVILLVCGLFAYYTFTQPKTAASKTENVQIDVKKEDIFFKYSTQSKSISYNGKVYGQNGCVSLKSYNLAKLGDKIILTLNLDSKLPSSEAQTCTQQVVPLPIQGNLNVELSKDEQVNLNNNISIKVNPPGSTIDAPVPAGLQNYKPVNETIKAPAPKPE